MKEYMTVAELATLLQTWAHSGHAEDIIGAHLYNGVYNIKDVIMLEHTGVSFINLAPVSNEMKVVYER